MRVIVQFPRKLHTIDDDLSQKVAFNQKVFVINCEHDSFIGSHTVVYNYFQYVKN